MTLQLNVDQTPASGRGEGATSYLHAIRARKSLVVAITLLTLAGSALWLGLRTPSYSASAHMLVTAIQGEDTFLGLDIVRESVDPTRTIQTAASLVESHAAAERTAQKTGGNRTPESVLNAVSVQPEGESSILSVTATAGSSEEAAQLANIFARSALSVRNENVATQASVEIEALQQRLSESGGGQPDLQAQLNQLESLREQGDPTLSIAQLAAQGTPAGASPALVMFLALLGGLAIGSAAAVLLEMAERRVRNEEDAADIWPIPILARIPLLPRRAMRETGFGASAPPAVQEAFRSLAVQLEQSRNGQRTVMITSPSTGDGKTTSAINLSCSLAASGHSVILMDLDLRKPDVAPSLGLQGIPAEALAAPDARLPNLLTEIPGSPNLRIFATAGEVPSNGMLLVDSLGSRLSDFVAEARNEANYVIVNTPPIGEVSDALRSMHSVDDVLIVTRPGNTDRAKFAIARDLLDHAGVMPRGQIVFGTTQSIRSSYYEYGRMMRERSGGSLSPSGTPSDLKP